MRPLRGLRVVEFAPHLPGQYLAQLLRHLGARVDKVESPEGDSNRRLEPLLAPGLGFIFASANGGKPSRRLDLQTTSGRRAVLRLLERADVVVQAFRPRTAKKLGIDWAACRRINPGLVYVEVTGWGPKGPWAQRHGHDLAYTAAAGWMDDERPVASTVGLGDLLGSLWGALCAVAALRTRRGSRVGRRISISIVGSALMGSQLTRAASYSKAGPPALLGGRDPFYGLYRCADDRFLAFAVVEERLKPVARDVLGVPKNLRGAALRRRFELAFRRGRRAEWLRRLAEVDLPCAPVNSAQEAPSFVRGTGAFLPPLLVRPPRARARAATNPRRSA